MWRGLYRAADLHTTRGDLGGAYWRRIPDSFAGFVANRPVPSLTETTYVHEYPQAAEGRTLGAAADARPGNDGRGREQPTQSRACPCPCCRRAPVDEPARQRRWADGAGQEHAGEQNEVSTWPP